MVINNVVCLLQIYIGNAYYTCPCSVRYGMISSDNIWLTVGLSVGCVLLVIIIIIIMIIAIACRRRRNKAPSEERESHNNPCAGSMEMEDEDERNYCSIPDAVAEVRANEYCGVAPPLPPERRNEYSALGPQEPERRNEYSELGPPPEATTDTSPYYLSLRNDYTCWLQGWKTSYFKNKKMVFMVLCFI